MAELGKQARGRPKYAVGLPFPSKGRFGTIAIANDVLDGLNLSLPGNPEVVFESDARTYTHEIGNILARRVTATKQNPGGDVDKYGAKNKKDLEDVGNDPDTGATFEKCVFGFLNK